MYIAIVLKGKPSNTIDKFNLLFMALHTFNSIDSAIVQFKKSSILIDTVESYFGEIIHWGYSEYSDITVVVFNSEGR